VYDSFDSLPDDIKSRIRSLIEPSDPEAWVKAPIQALGGPAVETSRFDFCTGCLTVLASGPSGSKHLSGR
jgi:hypothetical protein